MLKTLTRVLSERLNPSQHSFERVGFVGVVARKNSEPLNPEIFEELQRVPLSFRKRYPLKTIVTGGGSWAEHAALTTAMAYNLPVELYVPCAFLNRKSGYLETHRLRDPGKLLNTAHESMSQTLGYDTKHQLDTARKQGVEFRITSSFVSRSHTIATECDVLVVSTFSKDYLNKGGYLHTVRQAIRFNKHVLHYSLSTGRWGVIFGNGRISES